MKSAVAVNFELVLGEAERMVELVMVAEALSGVRRLVPEV